MFEIQNIVTSRQKVFVLFIIDYKEEVEELKRVYYLLSLMQPHYENKDADASSQQFLNDVSERNTSEGNSGVDWIDKTSIYTFWISCR